MLKGSIMTVNGTLRAVRVYTDAYDEMVSDAGITPINVVNPSILVFGTNFFIGIDSQYDSDNYLDAEPEDMTEVCGKLMDGSTFEFTSVDEFVEKVNRFFLLPMMTTSVVAPKLRPMMTFLTSKPDTILASVFKANIGYAMLLMDTTYLVADADEGCQEFFLALASRTPYCKNPSFAKGTVQKLLDDYEKVFCCDNTIGSTRHVFTLIFANCMGVDIKKILTGQVKKQCFELNKNFLAGAKQKFTDIFGEN